MAQFNPFFNEETGWTPLDEMPDWQRQMLNSPGSGMTMPGVDPNLLNTINNYGQNVNSGGGGTNWMDPFSSMSNPGGGLYPGMPNSPSYTAPGGGTNTPPPTPPATIASPSLLANNMSMTGAENVGGVGMYTGANGPLDLTRFTPVQNTPPAGAPPGSIPTGDPNTWITPWGSTYTTPGSINNSNQAEYDAYRQRAFGNMMGPQGRGPQSNPYNELTQMLVQQPGSVNAQTFQGYMNSLQNPQQVRQTGPNPPQQTAPLPPQGQAAPQPGRPSGMASPVQNFPGYNPQPLSGAFPMGDPRGTWGGMYDSQYGQGAYARMQQEQQRQQDQVLESLGLRRTRQGDPGFGQTRPSDLRLDPLGIGIDTRDVVSADGSPVDWAQITQQTQRQNPQYSERMRGAQINPNSGSAIAHSQGRPPIIGSPGTVGGYPTGGLDPGPRGGLDPYTGIYDPRRDPSSSNWGQGLEGPATYEDYLRQQAGSNLAVMPISRERWEANQAQNQRLMTMSPDQRMLEIQRIQAEEIRNAQQRPAGSFMADWYNQPNTGPAMGGGSQQPNYRQMASQFSSDPATQQAYLRDMFGGGSGPQVDPLPQVDFRAATFGGSLFPQGTGQTGGGERAPQTSSPNPINTTNPTNSQGFNPWANTRNRLSNFGNTSLFGNFGNQPYMGGGGGQTSNPYGGSQYRGAGTYGRPASYGTSQRPSGF